ncbi:MAG: tRNA (5-methylaminomethyl-2-thiouridine)(34)-methyltransferase MnmD [Flavobacteriales bacterium]|nr:tRNA (5-methylaminomethyl-2-thiouridine)(34)-methyltransferase MnmD [Flavobacteriales bacterium]
MKRQIVRTADGSSSIYLEEMDEQYHSKHGAIAESEHIFIQNGLLEKKAEPVISVFEVGMGTGLNVMTSIQAAEKHKLSINYEAIEAFPILISELKDLNFVEALNFDPMLFQKIHKTEWGIEQSLNTNFRLTKWHEKLQMIKLLPAQYDVIYFDAFAPEKQGEMWSKEIFEDLFTALKYDGILVTYCVKGEIRRRLKEVGFTVEKLPGPIGGKREICRARKEFKDEA